jgi:hypothetical protein
MLLKNAHPGYISWEQYEENLRRLQENAQVNGSDRRKSPPREGPALLQGMVVCGICGSRLTIRYHARQGRLVPEYVCQRDGIEHAISICQRVVGDHIDHAVGQLLVESVAPLTLEVTLSVQQELQTRIEEVDKLRRKQVERARYEADLAQRRYLRVDPANRLVADSLEADWNAKLRALTEAQEQYEQQRRQDRVVADAQQRARIAALASDFPRLWQDPKTPDRERKRMVRLLLADVTLTAPKYSIPTLGSAETFHQPEVPDVPAHLLSTKSSPTGNKPIDEFLLHISEHQPLGGWCQAYVWFAGCERRTKPAMPHIGNPRRRGTLSNFA